MSDFPHWPVRPVGEVFYVKGRIGWRNLRRSDFCDDGPYLITGMNIQDSGAIDWDACFHIPQRRYEESPEIKVRLGDLVITKDGTIGKVGRIDWLPGDTSLNSHLFLVRPYRPDQCSVRFAFHVFTSPAFGRFIESQKTGSTLAGLGEAKFVKFQFPTPTTEEQKVVGGILDTLDTTIHETEAIIAKLKAVKQGLLHDLLTRGVDANGELRPPQTEAPHLYKQSPLGWIPSDWRVQPLAAYTASDITYGIVQAGPHIPGGVPYIRTGDMSGDALVRESMLCTSRRIAESYARSEVRTGEIVMAIRATVGKVLPVPSDLDGANLTQGTARISPNARTDGTFLLWAIRHSRAQKAIQLEVKGTTFAEITLGALRQVPLAAPIGLAEQTEIGKRLTAVDEQLIHEHESLAKRHSEKAGLMDDLLTGRVRVTPLLEASGS